MKNLGPLSCAPYFSTNDIKKGVDPVLAVFEPCCARRNSLARTFRIELTRKTTRVDTLEQDRRTLQQLIAGNKAHIITALVTSTCLRETEQPRVTAEAIYTEIANRFKSA